MQTHFHNANTSNSRTGSVLLLVLVVVAVLTLGAYSFSEMMVSEVEATAMFGRQAESRAFADSGIELVAAMMSNPESIDDENIYHNPSRFQAVAIRTGDNPRGRGLFSVLAPIETDAKSGSVRFGAVDESSKINLNTLLKYGLDEAQSRNVLMYLPNMTEDIADAILDWLDEDDIPREFGVESDYYQSQSPAYDATNGGFKSLDELLQVAGVTPDLLYGEDANRNGILDPNEDDSDLSPPSDNQDGTLQLGWQSFLTIDSRESNLNPDGESKININDGLLTEVYEKLAEDFDEDIAKFVVALRANGPRPDPNKPVDDGTTTGGTSAGGINAGGTNTGRTGGGSTTTKTNNSSNSNNSSSNNSSNRSGSNSNSGSGSNSNNSNSNSPSNSSNSSGASGSDGQVSQSQLATGIQRLGNALGGGIQGAVTRGGIDLSKGSKYELKSIYELIGVEVETKVDGKDTVLQSPWSADPNQMSEYLPDLINRLTIYRETEIAGRINVGQARYEVLLGLPNMTEDIANAIVGASVIGADGQAMPDQIKARANTGWLVTQGIVDLPTMVKLDKYFTSRGSVFRAQVVGYFQQGGGFTRLEAVIDATEKPAKILTVRDMTDLGRGYPSDLLTGSTASGKGP